MTALRFGRTLLVTIAAVSPSLVDAQDALPEPVAPAPGSKASVCNPSVDLSSVIKPLRAVSLKRSSGAGPVPEDCGKTRTVPVQPAPLRRSFADVGVCWSASGLRHRPAYFEDVALERYGHVYQNSLVQSAVSGAKFAGDLAIVPYRMGLNPPCECQYTLGYHRPGDCVCPVKEQLPLDAGAAALQAAATVGLVFLIP